MSRRVTSPEFIDWLNKQLDRYHWNDSQASRLAGLDKGSISEIRRGINPGMKKCIALAQLFKVPEDEPLSLAGHRSMEADDEYDEATRHDVEQIAEILSRLSPVRQRRLAQELVHIARLVEDLEQAQMAGAESAVPADAEVNR